MNRHETKQALQDPNFQIDLIIGLSIKWREEREKCAALERKIEYLYKELERLDPDETEGGNGDLNDMDEDQPTYTLKEVAKEVGMSRKRLVKVLKKKGILYEDEYGNVLPYSKYVRKGYFKVVEGRKKKKS